MATIAPTLELASHNPEKMTVANDELDILKRENQQLKSELQKLQELFEHELLLITQLGSLQQDGSGLFKQHQDDLSKIFQLQLQSIPAQVIYRAPSSWNSTLWINVGERDNDELGRTIIAKNSPVIVATSVIGVVDFVGARQSRVRLITDSGLTPAVRALRGKPQNVFLAELVNVVIGNAIAKGELFESPAEQQELVVMLEKLRKRAGYAEDSLYLAKGELHGSGQPLWRSSGSTLKGIGFNYDTADEYGPARDLRTGKPTQKHSKLAAVALIKKHDLLVTSGLDGIFPAGLRIAEVTHVHALKEGDYYYELEAKPTAGNLDETNLVYVLPPIGYNALEQPPLYGWEQ